MLRIVFEVALPLVLPTLLYLLWLRLVRRWQPPGLPGWAALPWVWLTGTGVLLLVLMLLVMNTHFGVTTPGIYVPPRWQDGRIIPGHIEPGRAP